MIKLPREPATLQDIEPHLDAWVDWIVEQGGEVLQPTNPYEVLRAKVPHPQPAFARRGMTVVVILYSKAGGQLTWSDFVRKAWTDFRSQRKLMEPVKAEPKPQKAATAPKKIRKPETVRERLLVRDGDGCWFCGCFMPVDDVTLEHLLARAAGGTNHLSNLVLADSGCNGAAGAMSVAQKVAFRERLRARVAELEPWRRLTKEEVYQIAREGESNG